MRTNYLRHLANIIDIQWSRPVVGGGGGSQLNGLTCCKRQKNVVTLRYVADKHDDKLGVIEGQTIL